MIKNRVFNKYSSDDANELKTIIEILKAELKQAHARITELENQVNNEEEVNKILNSSFGGSEYKSMSFYGVPTREAKSPILPRNMTQLKKSDNQNFEFCDPTDKLEEGVRYYKYKARIFEKGK